MSESRDCARCGRRMQPFMPRRNLGGRMLCPMCAVNESKRLGAADWNDYRWMQDAQDRRYERAGVGGGKEEHDQFYGNGEFRGSGTEHRTTPREWMQQSREPRFEELPPHQHEWHRGFDMGFHHGRDSENANFDQIDSEFKHSPHPDHFYDGYSNGLRSAVSGRKSGDMKDEGRRMAAIAESHPHELWQKRTFGCYHTSNGRVLPVHLAGLLSPGEQDARMRDYDRWDVHSAFEPNHDIIAGARSYNHQVGLPDPHHEGYGHIKTNRHIITQVGRAYDALPEFDRHAIPHFEAMRHEIAGQYHHLTNRMGVKVHSVDYDPYKNVHEMVQDIRNNKRLKVMSTETTGGHPFFSNPENDQFRAVHDAFGHAATGRSFDANGEEAAFHAHAKMFTPHALPALASETRGQNASLHLNGDFGPQRIAVLPKHMTDMATDLSQSRAGVHRVAVRHGMAPLPADASREQHTAFQLSAARPNIVRLAHDSGSTEVIYHCFAGETRYLTREGTKSFAETVNTVQWVMSSARRDNHHGRWMEAVIHCFGPQPVVTVRLRRNKTIKVIRATHDHEWNVLGRRKNSMGHDIHRVIRTRDLKSGMRMAHLRLRRYFPDLDHEGVRMGFVFGDGAIMQRPHQTYGVAVLWGPKRDLAKYFDEVCTTKPHERMTANEVPGLAYTSGMVGYTKTLPPLTASEEYLHSWLMGYFAADGSVTKTNISMTSSVLENLQHVRDVATLLGIGTYNITSKWRTGFGVTSQIHTLGFSGADLGVSFFLREDHRDAFDRRDECGANDRERFGWTVDAVEDQGEVTPVYCARVPDTGSFVLEDNIWTRNCPFCGSGQVIARSDGTVECEFCQAAFTVQVQPEFSAFPQTIDGQPVDIPGMGNGPNPDVPPDEEGEQPPGNDPTAGPNSGESQPPEEGDPDQPDDEPIDSGGNPLFNKHSRRFTTVAGAALAERDYVKHLALQVTTNRQALLRRLREDKHGQGK